MASRFPGEEMSDDDLPVDENRQAYLNIARAAYAQYNAVVEMEKKYVNANEGWKQATRNWEGEKKDFQDQIQSLKATNQEQHANLEKISHELEVKKKIIQKQNEALRKARDIVRHVTMKCKRVNQPRHKNVKSLKNSSIESELLDLKIQFTKFYDAQTQDVLRWMKSVSTFHQILEKKKEVLCPSDSTVTRPDEKEETACSTFTVSGENEGNLSLTVMPSKENKKGKCSTITLYYGDNVAALCPAPPLGEQENENVQDYPAAASGSNFSNNNNSNNLIAQPAYPVADKIHGLAKFERKHFYCLCTRKFGSVNLLKKHVKRYTATRNFQCFICGMRFRFLHETNRHVKNVHKVSNTSDKNMKGCRFCGKKIAKHLLHQHQRNVHNAQTPIHGRSRKPCRAPSSQPSNSTQIDSRVQLENTTTRTSSQ